MPRIVNAADSDTKRYNKLVLYYLEITFIAWFTLEYLLRVVSAPSRFRFVTSFMGVIDFTVILPFYIALFMSPTQRVLSLHVIRIIRMIRVFRIFKLTRYSTGLKVLGKTIFESLGQLVALFLCLFLSAIMFASLIFYIEHTPGHSHEKNTFESIPDAFWYVVITKTTVGYGDVIPKTILGRIVASLCMVCGIIILLCLPTPVFITHFGRFYERVIHKPFNNDGGADTISDVVENNHLLVPTWLHDREWKKRLANDYQQNLCLNIYLSNSSLKSTTSRAIAIS